jgi:hypothetical protein
MHLKTITQRKFEIGQKNSLAGFIIFSMISSATNSHWNPSQKGGSGFPAYSGGTIRHTFWRT